MTNSLSTTPTGLGHPTDWRWVVLKVLGMAALLYIFILAIKLLGASFKLAGADTAKAIFDATENPFIGVMIGLLATSIIQSSSTTTSIIVGLVGGGIIPFSNAVPMIMGANMGTTITNTIVSMAHISRGDEFKRAFAGSVVHDFFNLCTIIVLLPLQIYFDIIGKSAHVVSGWFDGFGGMKLSSPLSTAVKPVAKWITHLTGDSAILSALIAIVILFIALKYIVTLLRSMVLSRVEQFFQRFIFRTPALGLILGILLTVMVQSSSITTSLIVPLLGAGVITLTQVYPYMMGANVGTTVTAFLASFVTGSPEAVSIAFAHLIFNTYGIAIFWPLKRIPISMAEKLAELTQKSKLIPIAYILILFFIIPGFLIFVMR